MNQPKPDVILTDKTHYILPADYEYSWQMKAYNPDDSEEKITLRNKIIVKSGFRWDGASVPRFLWWLGFKPDGRYRGAAMVHDFIYIHKGKLPQGSIRSSYRDIVDQEQHGSFSRYDADRLFGKMMKEAEVGKTKRRLMTLAVILFGGFYWQEGAIVSIKLIIKVLAVIILGLLGYKYLIY